MRQPIRFVGLDVHSKTVSIAVAEEGREAARHLGQVPNDMGRVLSVLDRLGPRDDLPAVRVRSWADGLRAPARSWSRGDLRRFSSAKKLMSYIGLVPSENSSGDRTRRGGITKAGNGGLRRLLIEAAWSYRHHPREAYRLKKRAEGVAPGVRAIAWKAQVRLNKRYRRMNARGKPKQKTLVAVARELAGFLWDAGRQDVLLTN